MPDERYDLDTEFEDPEVEDACEELLAKIDAIRDYYELDHIDRIILDILEEVIELL